MSNLMNIELILLTAQFIQNKNKTQVTAMYICKVQTTLYHFQPGSQKPGHTKQHLMPKASPSHWVWTWIHEVTNLFLVTIL